MITRARDERGQAIVEGALLAAFVFAALVQIVVLLGSVQRAALATTAAAREVGRAVLLAADDSDARVRADRVIAAAAADHGFRPDDLHAAVTGTVARGETLDVEVTIEVPILRVPFVGAVWPSLSVPVHARFSGNVDRYRGFADAG